MRTTLVAGLALALAAGPTAGQEGDQAGLEVPLEAVGTRLVVPVEGPGGATLRFALSTGATVGVLAASAAERLGEGAGLTLGGVPLAMEGVRTAPDEELVADGELLDGMIGSNTLNRFDALVDVPGGRLVLRPAGSPGPWDDVDLSDPVRLRVYHGLVLGLDVVIGDTEYPAMLDLGAPALLVNEAVAADGGVAGGRAATVRIGGVTFHDVPARVGDHPVLRRFSPGGGGFVIVGAPVAVGCPLSISWVRRELRTCRR